VIRRTFYDTDSRTANTSRFEFHLVSVPGWNRRIPARAGCFLLIILSVGNLLNLPICLRTRLVWVENGHPSMLRHAYHAEAGNFARGSLPATGFEPND
jgi:hypothetical protein